MLYFFLKIKYCPVSWWNDFSQIYGASRRYNLTCMQKCKKTRCKYRDRRISRTGRTGAITYRRNYWLCFLCELFPLGWLIRLAIELFYNNFHTAAAALEVMNKTTYVLRFILYTFLIKEIYPHASYV